MKLTLIALLTAGGAAGSYLAVDAYEQYKLQANTYVTKRVISYHGVESIWVSDCDGDEERINTVWGFRCFNADGIEVARGPKIGRRDPDIENSELDDVDWEKPEWRDPEWDK